MGRNACKEVIFLVVLYNEDVTGEDGSGLYRRRLRNGVYYMGRWDRMAAEAG